MVLDQAGEVVHRFGGLWHEGIVCDTFSTPKCIWKPSEYLLSSEIGKVECDFEKILFKMKKCLRSVSVL